MAKKINLALGGGGTKGFAHIGVIRQLELEGYEIGAIAGTSAGGIVGALYAFGISIDEMIRLSSSLKFSEIFQRSSDDAPSLLGLGGLYKELERTFGDATFENLKIKFAAVAVDTISGTPVILNQGKIVDAVKATTAVPGIFPAMKFGDLNLVDGGVLDPVPISTARWLNPGQPVVAVNLIPPLEKWPETPRMDIPPFVPIPQFIVEQLNQFRLGQAMHVFINSMEIMMNMITELKIKMDKPDLLIRPDVFNYTMFSKVEVERLVKIGEDAVKRQADDLFTMFSVSNRASRWLRVAKKPGKTISEFLSHGN
jgi:NTE family protein